MTEQIKYLILYEYYMKNAVR